MKRLNPFYCLVYGGFYCYYVVDDFGNAIKQNSMDAYKVYHYIGANEPI